MSFAHILLFCCFLSACNLIRAGKSGKAIAMVTQYDVEVYQRIEALLGKKLPEYSTADEETVLVLLERVNEAQRLATRELKEQLAAAASRGGGRASAGGQRKRRIGDGGSGGDDKGLESMLQKELRQGYAGGSGGRGGALPNQRGSGKFKTKNKQQRRR
jgi:superfamily II DNA/RNA helicase